MSAAPRALDALLEATNARFTRLRHPRDVAADTPPAARASAQAAEYIAAFWPHVAAVIAADPERLGLSFTRADGNRVDADALRRAFVAEEPPGGDVDAAGHARRGALLSAQAVTSQLLNVAVAHWLRDFDGPAPRCPLDFAVDADAYVSLRMLLPRRAAAEPAIDATAPVLVMGGTATAIAMCWNLLGRAPDAFADLAGRPPTRTELERIWNDTRELVFRIGAGSLAAFAAFASACSSRSAAMVWDGIGDLGLARRDGHYAWTVNTALAARYATLLERIAADQRGHYVGCAALYTRAPALPLAAAWADAVDAGREHNVFGELLRWITAVARRHYFTCFDAGD